jgi:serine/threonine-protein kinase
MTSCAGCGQLLPAPGAICSRCGPTSVAQQATADDGQDPPDLTGQLLNGRRFRLVRRLGIGGMGEVYEATDELLGRSVAIKLLAVELVASGNARRRMLQEANILREVQHPNVVRAFDVFEDSGRLGLVLELMTGGDLTTHIPRTGRTATDAIDLMQCVLSGLAALHAKGLVHRDLKPGNVLLTARGVPKLADLGVAKDLHGRRATRTGMAVGTYEYMSPEQVQGLEVDARSDLYAAGILFFELLSGRTPYSGRSDLDIQVGHVREQPDFSMLVGRHPPALLAVLGRALEKAPDARWPTADAFRAALNASVRAPAVAAPVEPIPVKTDQPASVEPRFVSGVDPLPLSVGPPPVTDTRAHRTGPGRKVGVVAVGVLALCIGAGLVWNRAASTASGPGVVTGSAPSGVVASPPPSVPPTAAAFSMDACVAAADLLEKQWQFAGAATALSTCITAATDARVRLDLRTKRAKWLDKAYQPKEALAEFQRALVEAPTNANLNNRVAWFLLTTGAERTPADAEQAAREALPFAERAVELSRRSSARILDTLAEALTQLGQVGEAGAVAAEIALKDPKYPVSRLDSFRRGETRIMRTRRFEADNQAGRAWTPAVERLFRGSDNSELTALEIANLLPVEKFMLRNALYARRGQRLGLEWMEKAFARMGWYTPKPSFNGKIDLTSRDWRNLRRIIDAEKADEPHEVAGVDRAEEEEEEE